MKLKGVWAVCTVFAWITASTGFVYALPDVPQNFWGYTMITDLEKQGALTEIMKSDGKFAPDEAITRGDFVALLIKSCANGKKGTLTMADAGSVKESIRPYVGGAQELGIFLGTTNENHQIVADGESLITREEAATMLGRLLQTKLDAPIEFDDADEIAGYAKEYVAAMGMAGVINGYENQTFSPKGNLTRAEAVSLVTQAKEFGRHNRSELQTYVGGLGYQYLDGAFNQAIFQQPEGVAVDQSGNLFICDTGNNLIRKAGNNRVSTLAGKIIERNAQGYGRGAYGDGKAVEAQFHKPVDVVVRPTGTILVADSENHSIRMIKDGQVYNYCGKDQAGYKNGKGQDAQFHLPSGIAADKEGTIYVADTLNHCIRKVDKNRMVTLFAGTPQKAGYGDGVAEKSLFHEPVGIAVANDGTVYVADSGNQRLRAIKNGKVSTVAGSGIEKEAQMGYYVGGYRNGDAHTAQFSFPQGICLGADGTLFIADTGNNVIRALLPHGKVVTVAGCGMAGNLDGPALTAKMNRPTDVAYSQGKLYIADMLNSSVRVLHMH